MHESVSLLLKQQEQPEDRLARIEALLRRLVDQRTRKDWYTTAEAAGRLGKAEFTVREWCRLGRINAVKRASGRGKFPSWVVSHEELTRYERAGLLPADAGRNGPRTS